MNKKYFVFWFTESIFGVEIFTTRIDADDFISAHRNYDIFMIVRDVEAIDYSFKWKVQ